MKYVNTFENFNNKKRVPNSGMEERVKKFKEITLDEAKEMIKKLKWVNAKNDEGYFPENILEKVPSGRFMATFGGGYYIGESFITLITNNTIYIIPATEEEYDNLISNKKMFKN
jgi:hypothetical protein